MHVALVCLFLLQFIPLSKCTTTCFSVLLMVYICVVFKILLLQAVVNIFAVPRLFWLSTNMMPVDRLKALVFFFF